MHTSDTHPAFKALPAIMGFAMAVAGSAAYARPTTTPPAITTLAPVVVRGTVPGPALWKVYKGDHVLWILGTTGPLPQDIHWESAFVQTLVKHSQEVIEHPQLTVTAKMGFWQGLWMAPHLVGVKKLPDGKTLHDVLPAPLYSRWIGQKNRYLTGIKGWHDDRLRPLFAAQELYDAALKADGLTDDDSIESQVVGFAKQDHVAIVTPTFAVTLKDPGSELERFKQTTMPAQGCLNDTLEAVEHGLAQTKARADAWATGNLHALQTVLAKPQHDACLSAITATRFGASIGLHGASDQVLQHWLKAATTALQHNTSTVALLSMDDLLGKQRTLKALAAEGYTVDSPLRPIPKNTRAKSGHG